MNRMVSRDQVVAHTQHALSDTEDGLSALPGLIKRILKEECWRERVIQKTGEITKFERFVDFVTAPLLEGLGTDVAMIRNVVRCDLEAEDLLGRALSGQQGRRTDFVDNVNEVAVSRPDGNARQYALRKLRKDAPKLHKKVLAGELSPHRAMVMAGFRKEPSHLDLLLRNWEKASLRERDEFLEKIGVPVIA